MKLYDDILYNLMQNERVEVRFPDLKDPYEVIESICYRALRLIKEILENPEFEDEECFMKIERIVNVFEDMGSGCGSRHYFG